VLVKWQGLSSDDATWELLQDFKDLYPDVQLEDELFEEAWRDGMTSVTYRRRGHTSP
jgi:transcriptional regulator GlxA family with amidase domain